jgi:hypothetical protein
MVIIQKKVGENAKVLELEKLEYEDMSKMVGGFIERVDMGGEIDLWINDCGKVYDMPINMFLSHNNQIIDDIRGDIFFTSHYQDETTGLSKAQEIWIMNHFEDNDMVLFVDNDGVRFVDVWDYNPSATL